MSSYDWEEVKRLAADFQRTQLGSIAQKLSERNCVEIISKLNQLKLLNVVYTTDGKSYITPKYLMKEIRDELYVYNGRANLTDIAKTLCVDDNVVLSLAHDIVKEDNSVRIILGQLIDHSFITHLAEELSDRLQQHGLINVTELTRTFDLPSDFIHSVIKENCSRTIHGVKQDNKDPQTYYTETFINQNRAIVKGALMAITKPTLINTVISHCGVKENIFFSVIDNLIESKQIPGVITERCGNVCSYIPQIYLKTQSEWVKNFYDQNGYLEYDALSRAGINDPKSFISKSVQLGETLQYLRKCAVGSQILEQIEASIDEAVSSNSWINILSILPTAIDSNDAEMILHNLINKNRHLSKILVFSQTYAVSDSFLNAALARIMDERVPTNVDKAINSGRYEQFIIEKKINKTNGEDGERELSRKEERKKRATVGKSGGGTQGRETKTKAVKKKYGQKTSHKIESDDEDSKKPEISCEFEFVSLKEIGEVVQIDKSFQDEDFDNSEFIDELNHHFYPLVNKAALSSARTLYESKLANMNNTKRKMNADLHDTIVSTYQDFKQYCKGVREFTDEDFQTLLYKYLLKTTGTILVNTCFAFVSEKNDDINSSESRQKILSSLDNKELKDTFGKLHKSLNGSSIDDFTTSVEDVLAVLNIMMKKMDKKREKSVLEVHKQALINKLQETDDPPLVLHLASLILFQTTTLSILNASGKFVAGILQFLKTRLSPERFATLQEYHDLVMKIFKLKEDEEEFSLITEQIQRITPLVKEMVTGTQTNK